MSHEARLLFEERLLEVIDMLFPDVDVDEYRDIENSIYEKIMDHDFTTILVSKLDINARMMAIMALELIAENMDLKKLREEFLNGQRQIQEKEDILRSRTGRAEHGIIT